MYMSDFDEIARYIRSHTINNDIVLTVGAGTITNLAQMLIDKPEQTAIEYKYN